MVAFAYPAAVLVEADGATVTFRDLPEAITGAATAEEALALARDAVTAALEARLANREEIPVPSAPIGDEIPVAPIARVAAKALVLHWMQRTGTKAGTVAERIGVTPGEMSRILDPSHRTGLDRLEQAIEAAGGSLILAAASQAQPAASLAADIAALAGSQAAAEAIATIMAEAGRHIAQVVGRTPGHRVIG